MKKLLFLIILAPIFSYGQTAEYGKIPNGKNVYDSYISKDGTKISVGDTIYIATPSSDNGFNYITQLGQKGAVFLSDRKVAVTKIRTYKDKRFEKRAYLQFKGYGAAPVDIDYELALKNEEIEAPIKM